MIYLRALAFVVFFGGIGSTAAQTWPAQAIQIVVPYPPGGSTDVVSRQVAQKLSQRLGQSVMVDNKAGASGAIGTAFVAKAAPDGYTLVAGAIGPFASAPSMVKNLPYDPIRDFVPVVQIFSGPNVLAVHPSVSAETVADLIRLARSAPGKLNFGSSGNGTSPHLSGELFKRLAKVDIVHVPYKGTAPAVTALIAGEIQILFDNALSLLPQARAGKVKILGVTTSARSSVVPDVPTIAETGLPGYEVSSWVGFLAPSGTPRPIVDRINREVQGILTLADIRESLSKFGVDPVTGPPEAFGKLVRDEQEKWGRLIREAGITAE